MADSPRPRRPARDAAPYAEIEAAGTSLVLHRPMWRVSVIHGLGRWGPDGDSWYVTGSREKAERKARRVLARYLREHDDEARPPSRIEVTDLDG